MRKDKFIRNRYLAAMMAAFAQPAVGTEGPPWVVDGTEFDIPTGSWETSDPSRPALLIKQGGVATGTDVEIKTSGQGAHAAQTEGEASDLTLLGGKLHTTGAGAHGLLNTGSGRVKLTDATIITEGGSANGARFQGNQVEGMLVGGSVTTSGHLAIGLLAVDGAQLAIESTHVSTTHTAAHGLAAEGLSSGLKATKATIDTRGDGALGVAVSSTGTAVLVDTSISTTGANAHALHSDHEAAFVTVTGGHWQTTGDRATGFDGANRALASLSGTHIETSGLNASGSTSAQDRST